jgi:hypothetical protein
MALNRTTLSSLCEVFRKDEDMDRYKRPADSRARAN